MAAADARLGRHGAEALIARDLGDDAAERAGGEVGGAGEGEVVGVAGVGRAERGRERREPAVEVRRRERGERGRGRRALREVGRGEATAEAVVAVQEPGSAGRGTAAHSLCGTTVVVSAVSACATASG